MGWSVRVVLLVLGASLLSPSYADVTQSRVRVVDGDSINIGVEHHRLHGIDAPELGQNCQKPDGSSWPCGQEAASALREKIGAQPITCRSDGLDRYGRFLSVCHAGGTNLNRWMVRQGWAVAYRKYASTFIPDEEQARQFGQGIWSGRFVMPWDWRRADRTVQVKPHSRFRPH